MRGDEANALIQGVWSTIRDRIKQQGPTRTVLAAVAKELDGLASQVKPWLEQAYPPPGDGEKQVRYLLAQDDQQDYALYLNAMNPGKKSHPHDHESWVCIASVQGNERNYLYDRLDDGQQEGYADIRLRETIDVVPGWPVFLEAGEIHAIEVTGDEPVWQLHFYGMAVEKQSRRLAFDMAAKKCFLKGVGVATVTKAS